ncbi:MAG: DUF2975 domain-containing protein [Winogradskyella sp.]
MKKLVFLKNIIDFIWFLSCIPLSIFLIFIVGYGFYNPETFNTFYTIDKTELDFSDYKVKIFLFIFVVLVYVAIYCFYLFRKTIRYFQKVNPFHIDVIKNFYKIGYLLTIIGLIATLLLPLSHLILEHKLRLMLGVSPYLGVICLGLFFMVLSEVFKVAKYAKEENNLTI